MEGWMDGGMDGWIDKIEIGNASVAMFWSS